MGQQAGGLALMLGGKIIGSVIGGPIGGAIGGLAGGLIASFLFNRSNKPLVTDYQLANSSYGRPIALIYGQWRLPGTVIWETDITTKSHSAGKGMTGQSTYSYLESAAFAFCQGPARLLKVWLDGKLFYDNTSTHPTELTKYKFVGRVYEGTEDQLPDPLIQAWDVGNVDPPLACPAYRGMAYIVIQDIDLSHYGGRMPNINASWSTDVEDRVIYRHFASASTDIGQTIEPTTYGSGTAVDWSTLRLYRLGYDGSLRMWDIQSETMLMSKTWAQLWPAETPPDFLISQQYPVACLAVCSGGNLYIVTPYVLYGGSFRLPQIITVDANTLTVIRYFPLPDFPGLINSYPTTLVPFQLISATAEPADMVIGVPLTGGLPIVINPLNGTNSGYLPTHSTSAFNSSQVVIGKQDTVQGLVEAWCLSCDRLSDPKHLYINKITITGDDPSAIEAAGLWQEFAVLTAADFGVTTGTPLFWYFSPKVAYDPADDTLIISDRSVGYEAGATLTPARSIKWKPGVGVIWTRTSELIFSNSITSYYDLAAGRLGAGAGTTYLVTDTATATTDTIDQSTVGGASAGFVVGYDSGANAVAYEPSIGTEQNGAYLSIAYLQRVAANEVPVAAILLDLCIRAGIAETDVDVSEVTSTTIGYGVTEEKTYGSAIADLCHTYAIDMVESDYKLKFIPRGGDPVATITQPDLASIDNDQSHYWQEKRALEQEMPLQINVRFNDPDLDFQTGASYAKRTALPVPTQFSKRIKTVDLPIAATNAEAHQIAERWLYTMWAERDTYQTKLAQKYLWLDPTDSVTVNLDDGDSISLRIETTDIGDDYSLKLDLASEDAETYVPSLAPGALVAYTPQTITQAPAIDLLQFNIPLLLDTDDLAGTAGRIYYAGGPTAAIASGVSAQLYESTDGGSAWPLYSTFSGFANWGYASTVLADTASAFSTDYVNTLSVTLVPGSEAPASCSYLDLMNGVNPVIVGSEIIQFQTATENADGTITLSTLLRGRRGTDWATGTHKPGEFVVFIAVAEIIPGRLDLAQLNTPELWKLVPSGRFIDSTPADSFTYRGYDLKPYAPINFKRTNSGADLVLTWVRRTRIGGLLLDGTDTAPVSEETEAYEVYLLAAAADLASFDPAVPGTYRRAFTGLSAATVTYTSAMMTADGFTRATDTLYMIVYQISAVIGRGFQGYQALPPF